MGDFIIISSVFPNKQRSNRKMLLGKKWRVINTLWILAGGNERMESSANLILGIYRNLDRQFELRIGFHGLRHRSGEWEEDKRRKDRSQRNRKREIDIRLQGLPDVKSRSKVNEIRRFRETKEI